MARRVSVDDIRQMNEIYYQCKSYAETARQTGWSASTVKNYIYLGGIEGILTSEMLGYGKESIESYIAALGSMIVMPMLTVLCLVLAFKKKRD